MPDFDYQGHTIHYETAGSGDPVVLLHCGGSAGRHWDRTAEFLADRFRLITPDFYGCGATTRWRGDAVLSHDDQARLVAAVMRREVDGAAPVIGHSYGGASAVRLALGDPHLVHSLVLIEPALTNLIGEAGDTALEKASYEIFHRFLSLAKAGRDEDAWRAFIDYYNGPGTWETLPTRAKARFMPQTGPTVDGCHSILGNPTTLADCRRIGVPTTVLCSETTVPCNRRVTEILRDEIPGAEWYEITGAGHMSPLSHPEAVARMIDGHLARTGTGYSRTGVEGY